MKNLIKYTLVFLTFISISANVKAQLTGNTSSIDLSFITDRNIIIEKYADVNGSPYLFKDWVSGEIRIGSSKLKNVLLKYDEVEDIVLINENGEIKHFTNPVNEFRILENVNSPRIFRAAFLPLGDLNLKTFYEVLVDGRMKFLRKNIKVISENKEYSGNISKSIAQDVKYFLVDGNNQPIAIKLDQKSIIPFLATHDQEVNHYIQTNKLNLKKVEDVIKLIDYYNSIN